MLNTQPSSINYSSNNIFPNVNKRIDLIKDEQIDYENFSKEVFKVEIQALKDQRYEYFRSKRCTLRKQNIDEPEQDMMNDNNDEFINNNIKLKNSKVEYLSKNEIRTIKDMIIKYSYDNEVYDKVRIINL
jgi:hypothetical protein